MNTPESIDRRKFIKSAALFSTTIGLATLPQLGYPNAVAQEDNII